MQVFFSTLPYSKTLRQLGSIACAALFLAACSSGGGDGGGGTSPSPAASSSSGTFVDSPVEGLGYSTTPSGLSGLTNANGRYNYNPGDMVMFNLFGRAIGGAVPAVPVVTPLSVFNATNITDPSVVNLSQLLLTLGGTPVGTNSIRVPVTPPANFPTTLDFSAPGFDTSFPGLTLVPGPTANAHLQANFSTLSVTLAGNGSVTSNPTGLNCGAICSADFPKDASVTLTPTGTGFTNWSEGCTGTGVCVVTLTANTSVTATFTAVSVDANLTVITDGNGIGSVISSPAGVDCGATCSAQLVQGTIILTANAANGSTFVGWNHGSGNANCSGTGTCSIPLTVNSSVTATFALNAVPVSVTANIASGSNGGGAVLCSVSGNAPAQCGIYAVGTAVTVTADPNSMSNFTGWSGGTGNAAGCTNTSPCVINSLTANTSITANFNRPRLTVVLAGTGTVTSNQPGINCPTPMCTAVFNKGPVTLTANGTGFFGWSGGGCSGTTTTCLITLTDDLSVTASFVSTTTGLVYPLTIGPTSRYLVDQNGAPFPILGRTAWFITSLPAADYKTFIDDTAAKGYNAIEFHVVNHDPRGNNPPFGGNGELPFTLGSGGPDFSQPNEAYWTYVDALLAYAESKGILCFMFPAYTGYGGGSQGWMQEMVANGVPKMTAYGAFIANRYKARGNIVWMLGGDYGTGANQFTVPELAVEKAMLAGIQSISGQASVNFSAEWDTESIYTDQADATLRTAGTLEGAYSHGGDVNTFARNGYAHSPAMTTFLLEEPYDEEGPDGNNVNDAATQPVRRFQWWGWLSGIGGYISGNGCVWPFNPPNRSPYPFCQDGWKAHLNTQGAQDMARLNAFVKSIAWYNLVPSGLNRMKSLVSGNSPVSNGDYVAAAATIDGTLLVAYVPPEHSGPITIDMTAMSGPTQARWFNPASAQYTSIGTIANTGTHSFTPPGNNGTGFSDWVLLLEKQ